MDLQLSDSALVGFFFWLVGWVCFTFLISSIDSPARTIGSVCNFLGNLLQYISIFVVAVGLIIAGGNGRTPLVMFSSKRPLPTDRPPTPKGRHHEIRGLGLREFAGLRFDHQRLDPFSLARFANLFVASFDEIEPLLSEETRQHLTGDGKDLWSGGAASHTLPGGERLIILNPTHSRNRQNATLMEEICHVFLGHKPSRLAVEARNKDGKVIARDYNHAIEEEAYSTGASP
ncbi:MAG: ImmA/IrrE family metallo-endopeptidase [Chloracidobacterium sp.]|nr:ImmA/IrrE family metallo-endopeptidase [Chloracidobacterium sp.]